MMNKCYRLVWNRAKDAWVAAAEIVKGRGGRPAVSVGSVPAGGDGRPEGAGSAFGTGVGRLRAHGPSFFMALEPRFMFDAAGAATAAAADKPHADSAQPDKSAEQARPHGHERSGGLSGWTPHNGRDHDTSDLMNALAQVRTPGDRTGHDRDRQAATGVLFVDPRVDDVQSLVAGVKPGIEVVFLDPRQDGITQISSYLQSHKDISSIYIFSHGSSGSITIGTANLDSTTITERSAEISAWSASLTANADILLYGCDVAAGSQGSGFIGQLARTTGADVAASTDATGAAARGGNWVLEAATGSIEARSPLTRAAMAGYDALLAAPTITDTATVTRTVSEDTSLAITGITIADADGDDQTVTLTSTTGTLTLATTAGLTDLSGNGTGSVTFRGTLAQVNAAITGMSFKGLQDANGAASFDIASYDGSTTITRTVAISVAAVNDTPTLNGNTPVLTVTEGGQGTFSAATDSGSGFTQSNLGLADVDNLQVQVILKVTDLADKGTLYLNGNELAVGSTFSVSQISGLVYKHNGDQVLTPTTDTFRLTIDDGAGGVLTNQQFTIAITPVNQAPTVAGTIRVIEGETNVSLTANGNLPTIGSARGAIGVSDPDDTTFSYSLVSLPTIGTLYYNGSAITAGNMAATVITDLNLLTYSHDGSEPTDTGAQQTFDLKVIDSGGGTGVPGSTTRTITLDILDNNDDPALVNHVTQNLTIGEYALTITPAMLKVTDSDSFDNNLTYTLTAVPDSGLGYYTLNGYLLTVNATFTQKDITDGNLVYHMRSYSSVERTDTIEFTVKDGAIRLYPTERNGGIYDDDSATSALTRNTFNIIVPPSTGGPGGGLPGLPAEATTPVVTGDHAFTVTESGTYILTNADLLANDGASPDSGLVYRLNTLPSSGTFSLNGVPLGQFGTFTQADITAGHVTFVHSGAEDFASDFQFSVSNGKLETSAITFYITATPQNDTPTAAAGDRVFLAEGATVSITDGNIVLSDSDRPADIAEISGVHYDTSISTTYAVTNGLSFIITALPDHGYLTLDGTTHLTAGAEVTSAQLADGSFRYVHDGTEHYTDSFRLTPRDNMGVAVTSGTNQTSTGAEITVPIIISPLNDAPVYDGKSQLVSGQAGAIYEGQTVTIGGATGYDNADGSGDRTGTAPGAYLIYTDQDNTSVQRQYRVTTATQHGQLLLNGVTLGVNSVFTQADLDAGRISYRHDGSEGTASDYFEYVVSDGDYSANDAGSFVQGAATTSSRFNIEILPANDKPTLTAPTGTVDIDSADAANNKVIGFVVADPDLTDGINAGETDFVQVTVRLLDASGNPITNYATGFAGGGVSIGYTTPVTGGLWAVTQNGTNNILQIQGTRQQVNDALAGLSVTFANDANALYKLQVIVDDRMRDSSGALTTTGSDANGGELNQAATPGGAPTAVPATAYDWRSAATPAADDPNITVGTVDLRASRVNEAATFTGPGTFTVNEDTRTQINGFTVSDPESAAFDTPVTVTISTGSGTLDLGATGAQTSITPSGGQAITISGDNTATITLTGRAADIQALLNGRNLADSAADANGGLFYKSDLNVNHDTNGGSAGDVTLTLSFNDAGSRIGSDTGSGSVANNPADITTALDITAINDAPVVNHDTATIAIDSIGTISVSGFSVTDVDSNDGYAPGETNGTIQVTVRVLDNSGNPLAAATYASLGITLGSSTPGTATVDGAYTGVNGVLELHGTLSEINTYLSGLHVIFANLGVSNLDASYAVEVVADDRLRDVTGTLAGSANGGANNQQTNLPAVPATDTFDPYATKVSDYGVYNVVGNTRPLFVSSINDPGAITANDVTVNEGSATLVLDTSNANITIADPDDNGSTTISATVTVGRGTITTVGGAGGSVTGIGTATITITGATEAQINSRLQALTITYPDPAGSATSADWNGSFTVTVVYNDAGSTGTRPGSLAGDTNDPTANPGDYSYADGSSNILVTTRTFTVTVTGVNDAPTRTTATVTLTAGTEDTDGGGGDTVSNLFGASFSDALDNVGGNGSSAGGMAGIAITTNAAITAQGRWQYSTDGTTWTDLPAVGTTTAFLLKTTDHLRFVPAADFHGTPGGLTARLVDDSSGAIVTGTTADVSTSGGSTRYSDSGNAVTLGTTVATVNDRPTATNTLLTSIYEDNTNPPGATVSGLGFGYGDTADDQHTITGGGNDATPFGGIAIVGNAADATTQGVWQYNTGGGWTTIGSLTDATALILPTSAQLRFLPVADYNGTPGSLTVRVADSAQVFSAGSDISATVGDQTSTWSLAKTLDTTVIPLNDAPAITGTIANPTFTENGAAVALITGGGASDIDLPGTVTFGGGTITVTLDNYRTGDVLSLAGTPAGVASIDATDNGNGVALVIHLNTSATPANLGAILDAIRFANTSDDPTGHKTGIDDSDRAYTIRLNDGNNVNGGVNAGGPTTLDSNILSGTITVTAVNDPPVAVDDANSIHVGTSSVTGNVKTNDSDVDNTNAQLSVVSIRTGGTEGAGTAGTVGGDLVGSYGTLTLNADGSYTYHLDTGNPAVDTLLTGDSLQEYFNYTIEDPSHAADTAVLHITINGGPRIVPADQNQTGFGPYTEGQNTVYESGLTSDGPAGQLSTAAGTIAVSARGGLNEVTIGGTTLDLAALGLLTGTPVTINTGKGTLTLTGFTPDGWTDGTHTIPTGGTLTYTYSLNGRLSNPVTDDIALGVRETGGSTSGGTLQIRIVEDAPTATADVNSVTEDGTATVTGNVVTGISAGDVADRIGADTTATPVTAVGFGGDAKTIGTAFDSAYGSLTLHADGSYSYTLDNSNPLVSGLRNGQTLTETFHYTITDADGDTAATTLTITIHGVNDAPVLSSASSLTINEDSVPHGTPLSSLVTASDAESGSVAGLAIVGNAADPATQGVWEYSIDGSSWTAIGAVGDGANGLALSSDTQVRFVPNADYNGTPSGLSVRALDDTWTGGFSSAGTRVAVDTGGNGGTTAVSAAVATIGITVVPVNDAPLINGLDAISVNAPESRPYVQSTDAPIIIDPDVSFSDRELGTERDNWSGATLTISRQGGASTDDVFSASGGDLALSGGTIIVGGQTIGTYTNGNGALVMTFDANATTTLVTRAAQDIRYSNVNAAPTYSSVTLDWTLNDRNSNAAGGGTAGGGQDQGLGGQLTDTRSIVISMNRPPVAAPDTADAIEAGGVGNATPGVNPTGNVLANDTDPDLAVNSNERLSVTSVSFGTVTGTPGQDLAGAYGTLRLNADGSYTYAVDNGNAAVQALRTSNDTLTEVFTYSMRDTAGLASGSTLTVTIHGANDNPVATADTADAVEAGGLNNGTPGSNATGNVLTNDTDIDTGDGKTVATTGTFTGLYGTLTLNPDGGYSYAADNANPAVQALNVGDSITDVFTYTMKDTAGATSTATLTIAIHGANDHPVNTLPADPIISALQAPVGFGGLHVDDVDSPVVTVTLSVEHGVLQVIDPGSPTLAVAGNGTGAVTLTGSLSEINALIAGATALTYTPDQSFSGRDPFTMSTNDGHVTVTNNTTILVTQRLVKGTDTPPSEPIGTQFSEAPLTSVPPAAVTVSPEPLVTTSSFPHSTGSYEQIQDSWSQPDHSALLTATASQRAGLVIMGGDDIPGMNGLYVVKTPSSQESLVNQVASFNLPQGVFRHSDANAKVTVEAKLADGQPLPDWITFDPDSGRFTAKPPIGSGGYMDIKILARDQDGNVAETQFLFHITESKSNKPAGVNTDTPDDGSPPQERTPGRVTTPQGSPGAPRSDLRDGLKAQRYASSRALKGRPSLAEQMASHDQRNGLPAFFTTVQRTVRQKGA